MADDYSKVLLDESEMPTRWYNVIPDLPEPPPPPPPPRPPPSPPTPLLKA